MHDFLKAVGFSNLDKNKLRQLINDVIENATYVDHTVVYDEMLSEETEIIEMKKTYADHLGISVCGTYNDDGSFCMEYYYPYFEGSGLSTREKIDVQKYADKNAYAVVCDDINVGVTLIYYMQNICEYMSETKNKEITNMSVGSTLGALSVEGKILLPVEKNEKNIKVTQKKTSERNKLIMEARSGDEKAIESLTLEDIETNSLLARRIAREDILSIVSSYFMPFGIESDQYSVLGEIISYYYVTNEITDEKICIMTIDTNGLKYDVCINEKNLVGVPDIGRRFKGNIWMQGTVRF